MMFMRHFSNMLDRESPDWRDDTIITMDNALYHVSSESLSLYKDLKLPIMLNPPHGYNVAPVELVFAFNKATSLNRENLSRGKSIF